ncbi:MAG: hypothetical protein AAFR79_16095 [Pseudomonadota bacterium]
MQVDPSTFDPIDTDPQIASYRKNLMDADSLFAAIERLGGPAGAEAARHRAEIANTQDLLERVDQTIDAAGQAFGVYRTRH